MFVSFKELWEIYSKLHSTFHTNKQHYILISRSACKQVFLESWLSLCIIHICAFKKITSFVINTKASKLMIDRYSE